MVFTSFKNKLANIVFMHSTDVTLPTAYYLGLSTTTPNADGTGITEPSSDTGYSRIKMTSFNTPTDGIVTNTDIIDFGEAVGEYGMITHAVFFDGAGDPCFASELSSPVEVNIGDIFRIKSGNASLGFGGV